MQNPRTAVHDYLGAAPGAGDSAPEGRQQPELLTMPLARRRTLHEQGRLSGRDWERAARDWAMTADHRYRACVEMREPGRDPGALRIGVKDTVDAAGFATRLGLRRYRHHPRRSAAPLESLRRARITAKVVTTELNIGVGSGCLNPYFPHIDPAGSSTGSGVAVAAGICDVSLGTDVLGSVRWPAGRCGVVGLRVTHDPAALRGVFPLSPGMDAPGWVARTADDLEFAWAALGLGRPAAGTGGLRIGVPERLYAEGCLDPEIAAALGRSAEALTEAGHTVAATDMGEVWDLRGAAWELCARDAWDGYQVWRDLVDDDLMPSTVKALEAGAKVGDERAAAIRRSMARIRAGVGDWFAARAVDAWLLPLDPGVPLPRGTKPAAASTIPEPGDPAYDREVGFTPVASFAGLPALTLPVGRDGTSGAPLAMQLVGRPHDEPVLLRLARQLSGVLGDPGFGPAVEAAS